MTYGKWLRDHGTYVKYLEGQVVRGPWDLWYVVLIFGDRPGPTFLYVWNNY